MPVVIGPSEIDRPDQYSGPNYNEWEDELDAARRDEYRDAYAAYVAANG